MAAPPIHLYSAPEPKKTDARAVVEHLSHVLELLRDPEVDEPMSRVAAEAALNLTRQISGHLHSVLNKPRGFARYTAHLDRPSQRPVSRMASITAAMQQQRLSTVVQKGAQEQVQAGQLGQPPPLTQGQAAHGVPPQSAPQLSQTQMPTSQSAPQLPLAPQTSEVTFALPAVEALTPEQELLHQQQFPSGDLTTSAIDSEHGQSYHGLNRSSSAISVGYTSIYPGASLPIVLPGKLQWVRDTHRRLGIPNTTSLGALGIHSLASEAFFGPYPGGDPRNDDQPGPTAFYSQQHNYGKKLAPIYGDDGIASRRSHKSIRAEEKRKEWNVQSFDRKKFHG